MKSLAPRAWTLSSPGPLPDRRFARAGVRPGVRIALGLCLGLALAACGVPREARRGARVLAAYTNQIKAESDRFARGRTALARARQRNAEELEQSAIATEQANQREVFLWGVDRPAPGPGRQDLFQGIVAASNAARTGLDDLAARRKQREARVARAATRMSARNAELAGSARILAQLGESPSFKQRMMFYLCFFESVQGSVEEAQQAGAAQTQVGTAAAQLKQYGEAAAPETDDQASPPAAAPPAQLEAQPAATPAATPASGAASKSACLPAS